MGHRTAIEIAEALPIDDALAYHLRVNHFPPIPLEMVAVCKEAIGLCNEGLENNTVDLPHGTSYRNAPYAPAWAIVDAHHLSPWIEREED
jgi:hypothetical protein